MKYVFKNAVRFACLYLLLLSNLYAIYRPYDIYRPSASSLGKGGTGVSNPEMISDIVMNPAHMASLDRHGVAIALDGQFRVTRLLSEISIEPQYVPVFALGLRIDDNSGLYLGLHSPFQRVFAGTFFLAYSWEVGYSYTLFRYLDVGVTLGAMMAIEARVFVGWGFAASIGLLSQGEYGKLGLFFRVPTNLSYSNFSRGVSVTERTPPVLRAGASKEWWGIEFSLELEYIFWEASSFKEFGVEVKPDFKNHFLAFLHPHIGFAFSLEKYWPGLKLRTGIYTEDYFDHNGNNARQILLNLGISGIAYSDFWGDRLSVDIAYSSSSILSVFWGENNQIEKFQISFNYYFGFSDKHSLF